MAGQDASWDLQNYHGYTAYALPHWRYPLDVGTGGFHGYSNPLPYLVPYGLRHLLPPLAAGLLIADLQPSALVLGGLLLLPQVDTENAGNMPQARWRLVLAGVLVGAAAGLKLTNGGLACPVWIALGLHPTAGVPVTEPRLLLALVAAALAILVKLRRAKTPPVRSNRRMARAGAFLAASMTAWLGLFAIQR